MPLNFLQFSRHPGEFVHQLRNLLVYIIIGVLVRLRPGDHDDLPVIGVQIQHNGIQLPHGVSDFTGNGLHGNGVVFAGCEIDIHVLAVAVLYICHLEIGVVVELHLIHFLAQHLAVNVNPAVGVKAAHFLLPRLNA